MPGVKGAGGPPPKRSEQRRRTNTPAAGEPTKAEGLAAEAPGGDEAWHPVALRWYDALKVSGQARFYEASDWATAYLLAESISRELQPQPFVMGKGEDAHVEMLTLPPKGASLAAWLKGMTSLLTTEGDRRRAALELQKPKPAGEAGADVSELDEWRLRLHGGA